MQSVTPIGELLRYLAEVAAAGFDASRMRIIAQQAGWEQAWDDEAAGFANYYVLLDLEPQEQRALCIGFPGGRGGPYAKLPLNYFEAEGDFATVDRGPFDDDYRRLAKQFSVELSQPQREGTYVHDHRPNWPYNFSCWERDAAQFLVLQDEHDIQFGLDITLWAFPATTKVFLPFHW